MDENEHLVRLEKIIENLIIVIGSSNRQVNDFSRRLTQIEQYIVEVAPTECPFPDASRSFIAMVEKPSKNAL